MNDQAVRTDFACQPQGVFEHRHVLLAPLFLRRPQDCPPSRRMDSCCGHPSFVKLPADILRYCAGVLTGYMSITVDLDSAETNRRDLIESRAQSGSSKACGGVTDLRHD